MSMLSIGLKTLTKVHRTESPCKRVHAKTLVRLESPQSVVKFWGALSLFMADRNKDIWSKNNHKVLKRDLNVSFPFFLLAHEFFSHSEEIYQSPSSRALFRPNPHRMRDAMHNATQANGTCWCEWGYPHCTQATSKEKRSNLCARRVPRPVWIGPYQFWRRQINSPVGSKSCHRRMTVIAIFSFQYMSCAQFFSCVTSAPAPEVFSDITEVPDCIC